MEHFDLSNKKAVVFGANSPAGNAIAETYEQADARVIRLNQCHATEVADKIIAAADDLGGIDLLVCATDQFLAKPISETSMDDLASTMMVNFAAPFMACQAALSYLKQAEAARIVMLTSVLGERGLPNTSVYSAAHGAVFNFIRALAQEVAADGITVNGIELGWMDWMTDRINPTDENAARAVRFTISKRAGTTEDVGALALWLAGSGASFVTGQIFPLDGGLTQHL